MKKMLIGVLLSLAGLYIAFRQIDLPALGSSFSQARWSWVLLAASLLVFSVWVRAVRWRIFLLPLKAVSISSSFSTTMIGYFGNSVLPLRLGEILRAYAMHEREKSVSAAGAFGTIVVERLVDLAGALILTIVFFQLYDVPAWLNNAGIFLGITVLGGSGLLWWISSAHREWLDRIDGMTFFQRGFGLSTRHLLHSFVEGLITLRKTRHFGRLFVYSLVLWLLYLLITKLTAFALSIDITWIEVGVILIATTFVISVPSAPGFIGTYHAAAVLVMTELFGRSEPLSQAFAILNHAVGFVPLVTIGFFYQVRSSIRLREVRGLKIES